MTQAKNRDKSKHWCFTINNPKWDDVRIPEKKIEYLVIGQEIGRDGTPHLQGYVNMVNRTYFEAMKKWLPRAHLERMQGTMKEASEYCKKDGFWSESGPLPEEGYIKGGKTTKRLHEEAWDYAKLGEFEKIDPVIRFNHYHTCKRLRQDYQKPPPSLKDVCGIWIVGPPKTGKSTLVRETWDNIYDKPANKWWDGYQGELIVLIDDFDTAHKVLGHHLKRWFDKFSFPAEMKGTTVQIRPQKIIVTSNYRIEEIWQEDPVLIEAISRRCNIIQFIKSPGFNNVIPINII